MTITLSVPVTGVVSTLQNSYEGARALQRVVMELSVPSKNDDEGARALQRSVKVSVPLT